MLTALVARMARANLDAATFRSSPPLPFVDNLLLILLHAAGLLALGRYVHLDWPIALMLVLGIALGLLVLRAFVPRDAAFLAPLFLVYLLLIARYVYIRVLHGTVSGYFDYAPADWTLPFLYLELACLAALGYSGLIVATALMGSRRRTARVLALLTAVGAMIWASWDYIGHRTSGTTGSDPYAYVQMGVDLARHGSPLHRFPLVATVAPLGIPWYPLLHVGYRMPVNAEGDAPTVWPPGGAASYAAAYAVFGEAGLYWVNPLFSLLAVAMSGVLAWELARNYRAGLRALVAAGTILCVATSHEQAVWAGVTMVDAQAEFFSALAVYAALKVRPSNWLTWSAAAGAALGAAYLVRHTQLVLAASMSVILLFGEARPVRLRAVFAAAIVGLALALPDLWYHQLYLGGWAVPESEELAQYSLAAIPASGERVLAQLLAANELGWFAILPVVGLVSLWGRNRLGFTAVALWLAASLALHLPYAALRLRDLLPELPAVALLTVLGIGAALEWLLRGGSWPRMAAAAVFVLVVLDLFALRVRNTVPGVIEPAQPIFGYMTGEQRQSFESLSRLVPDDAIVGSSLNDGAIDLYAHRRTFRPDAWQAEELTRLVSNRLAAGEPVYVLEDSETIGEALSKLKGGFRVTRVSTLDVPLFGERPVEQPGALWKIER